MSSSAPLESTRFAVLLALAEAPLHGYAAYLKIIEDNGLFGTYIQTSTVYKTLDRLVVLNHIEKVHKPNSDREVYKLTINGARILKSELDRLEHSVKLGKQRLAL